MTSNALDSILTVWSWGSKVGADSLNRIFHANCPKESQIDTVQTVSTGTTTSPIATIPADFLWEKEMPGSQFVRLAGLSGALAISLGAYGAHVLAVDPDKAHYKTVFDTANKYHLVHSAVLLAIPNCRRPHISGSLILGGMLVFCGSTYYHALTEDTAVRKYTPYGGMLLILGWLSLIL